MGDYLNDRDIQVLKSNTISGLFDGVIFGLCFAGVYAPVALYQPGINSQVYKKSLQRYLGKSIIKGAPLVAITRCIADICEKKEIGTIGTSLITFSVAIAYISLSKFP